VFSFNLAEFKTNFGSLDDKMASDETELKLMRENFDTLVDLIIEKAKLTKNKEELRGLKVEFQKISCEIVQLVG
jgi:hypothetical protein